MKHQGYTAAVALLLYVCAAEAFLLRRAAPFELRLRTAAEVCNNNIGGKWNSVRSARRIQTHRMNAGPQRSETADTEEEAKADGLLLPKPRRLIKSVATARRLLGFKNNALTQIAQSITFPENSLLASAAFIFAWLAAATATIGEIEGWKLGQSFFFVIDTGLCRGFGAVKPATELGQVFTIANELIGAGAAAVVLGQFAQRILEGAKESGAVAKVTRIDEDPEIDRLCSGISTRGPFKSIAVDITGDGIADGIGVDTDGDGTVDTVISYDRPRLLTASRAALTAALAAWVALGAAYGAAVEGWSPLTALFFALTTLGIGGLQAPAVDAAGALPEAHAVAVGAYVLVGVPLFAAAVGDYVGYFLEDSIRKEEREAMDRPIQMRDFEIASQLIDADGSVGKAEYVLLELMRLGKTDVGSIAVMAQRFERMDHSGDGALDLAEIISYNDSLGRAAAPRRAAGRAAPAGGRGGGGGPGAGGEDGRAKAGSAEGTAER